MAITLRVKDKEGVRIINVPDGIKPVMIISQDNAESLFKSPKTTMQLMKELGLAYIFVCADINKLTIMEKEQFARYLVEGAPKNEQKKA